MKITIYSDLHIGTPLEMNCLPTCTEQVLAENAYSIGDIFDRKGAALSSKASIENQLCIHNMLFKGARITGNHEVLADSVERQVLFIDNIMLVHGDIFWGIEKANAFRAEKPYQGYGCFKSILALGRRLFAGRLSHSEAKAAAVLAQQNRCNTIIFGHTHVASLYDETIAGVRVLNVPRGRTELIV